MLNPFEPQVGRHLNGQTCGGFLRVSVAIDFPGKLLSQVLVSPLLVLIVLLKIFLRMLRVLIEISWAFRVDISVSKEVIVVLKN
jgi:prepilin signal peptidase PulO-like enzyme (type II secretory pathway)